MDVRRESRAQCLHVSGSFQLISREIENTSNLSKVQIMKLKLGYKVIPKSDDETQSTFLLTIISMTMIISN